MNARLPPLIHALLEPARYADVQPAPVERVELIETHGAWVLLAGAFAYKIKKPVRFPFMDFSSLALRRQACETEIRVNRRFQNPERPATQLYLRVLPIVGTSDEPRWGSADTTGAPQVIEYAVQMRRFDDLSRLDHLCQRDALKPRHMTDLAQRMAVWQAQAVVAGKDLPWGHPAAAMRWPRDNFNTLLSTLQEPAELAQVRELGNWTEQRFHAIEPLLSRRRQKGRVREGHGDLHLANLVLVDDEVLPFDAIEFNDEVRWIDVASDMAFVWMDLLNRSRPGLANVLLSAWLDATGDVSAPTVWTFFASYRAGVRAKVAALRLGQLRSEDPDWVRRAEADSCIAELRRYLALASDMAHPPSPQLLITHGLSGSGKTFASSQWLAAERSGRAIRLRSDVERKRLHGLSALANSGSALNTGLYSPEAHGATYASLLDRSRMLLADGWTVLVDAAFLRRAERMAFSGLAQAAGVPFHILACEAPLAVLQHRIRERQAQGTDASEANAAVLEQQLGWLEPLAPDEHQQLLATPG